MEALSQIFPVTDYALLGVILALPLLGAIGNGIFGQRLGKEAVSLMGLSSVGLAFVFSVASFLLLVDQGQTEGTSTVLHWTAWNWMEIAGTGPGAGTFRGLSLDVAFRFDALSGVMSLIVTGIGFLIHLYSTKYMEHDAGYYRFFAYLNLFIFSMMVLILGDSLPILFVGWEGVGLCSYLLIGFWFGEEANASAGKKAFITNRVGDFGLLVAMGLLAFYVGALDWSGINAGRESLLTTVKIWPVSDTVPIASLFPESIAAQINAPRYASAATLVCLALFLGAMGKSAQLGLHVWLPDAMAGPTPVSALIHAATMVTAGVYLLCRLSGLFVLSPMAMFVVALLGALTALFAASIALVQNDIKKVLAYSTVSQLGYMFLGVGVGAFTAGFFHVFTHAFFKACLFLGAGSVIHAMHARIHGTDASQDMRNMGGLRRFLPATYLTFGFAWAAIVGFPLTSGFWSKDEILFKAKTSFVSGPEEITGNSPRGPVAIDNFQWTEGLGTLLYAIGLLAAIMTAFYMTRLFVGIFFGKFRGWTIEKDWRDPHADDAEHHEHHDHEQPGPEMKGPVPHESPWQMTWPLWILGALALVGGFLNAHPIHLVPLDHVLEPVFAEASASVATYEGAEGFLMVGMALAVFVAFGGGVGLAYWMYVREKGKPAAELVEKYPRLHSFLADKWRVDEFYQETIIGAVDSLAEMCVWADRWIVDGILARFTAGLIQVGGTVLRQFQTGRVQAYAAAMTIGILGIALYIWAPHASIRQTVNHGAGNYALVAAPGLGYSYRWDVDGEQGWDSEKFSDQKNARFNLEVTEERTVRVQVKNAFGVTSEKEFTYVRPRPDASRPGAPVRIIRGADGKLRAGSPPGKSGKGARRAPGDDAEGSKKNQRPRLDAIKKALEQQRGEH